MSLSPPQGESSSSRLAPELSPVSAGKKGKLSAHERQAQAISKLLANPDKEIHIPDGPKEKSIRPARDVMKNVTGSSAGAGSGEFHVYKQQRRREYERIQLMEEQNRKVCSSPTLHVPNISTITDMVLLSLLTVNGATRI